MIVRKSTDSGAPTLNGSAGSLVTVLNNVLLAAGWTKEFGSGNRGAYRPSQGTRFYLRVQDNAAFDGRLARLRGYETMSDVNTGTAPFPAADSGFTDVYLLKSHSSNSPSDPIPWIAVVDERTMYFFAQYTAGTYSGVMFGDYYSTIPDETKNCMIIGRDLENDYTNAKERLFQMSVTVGTDTILPGHFKAGYTGAQAPGKAATGRPFALGGAGTLAGSISYPNARLAVDVSPVQLFVQDGTPLLQPLGYLRGFWQFGHRPADTASDFPVWSTFGGVGDRRARQFITIRNAKGPAGDGVLAMETAYWEANP
jgi:hypothetical protein